MSKKYSALIEQQPIVITPCMVEMYGAAGAIFAQQLWYWQQSSRHIKNNKAWVYNTREEWSKQTGLSEQSIRTAHRKLEQAGVIEVSNFNKLKMDKTLWYHLDVELIREQTDECVRSRLVSSNSPFVSSNSRGVDSNKAIPETTHKTTTYNTAKAVKPDVSISRLSGTKRSISAVVENTAVLLDLLNSKTDRKFRVLPRGSKTLLKTFSLEEIATALDNLVADDWHRKRIGELSSDYLLRASTIDKWLNYKTNTKKFV